MTSMEREEKEKGKKREKKLEDEEILQQATWVKYTIPIKHQVKPPLRRPAAHWAVYRVSPRGRREQQLIGGPEGLRGLRCASKWDSFWFSVGVEAEGGGIPSDWLRRLELDQQNSGATISSKTTGQHQRKLPQRAGG